MKNNIKALCTLALLCATQLLTAQCSTNFLLEDFNNHTAAADWQPDNGFVLNITNPLDGSGSLITDPTASSYQIEQCYDLSSLNHARITFDFLTGDLDVLKFEYSLDGVAYVELWYNDVVEAENIEVLIPASGESLVYLRFVATESGAGLDNIQVHDGTIDLCYGYDLAGNRTSTDLIAGLVSNESEVAHISPEQNDLQQSLSKTEMVSSSVLSLDSKGLSKQDFSIFPNPTTNVLNLSSSDSANSYPIQVYDQSGKLVHKTSMKGQLELQVSDWVNGTYFVYILSGDKKVIYKVIKI